MQASICIRFICFLVTVLILCASTPQANAGVRVSLAEDLEKHVNFLVTTDIYYHRLEGYHVKHIGSSFLTAGGTKHIAILGVWPLLYSYTYAYSIHPVYWSDSVKSDKAPFALRAIEMPTLRPQSWRHLLDSGETPEGRSGIVAAIVNHHFGTILEHYLPAFDRARIKEDLRQYLPLLRELAAFAHRERVYKNRPAIPGRGPMPHQKQDEPQLAVLEHYRKEMDERLKEIEGWLALDQDKRAPMHDWIAHFHKGDYVYREIMTDNDRSRLLQWLDSSFDGTSGPTLQWTNSANGLVYTADRGFSGGMGTRGFGYSITLTVDLNPILGLKNNRRYVRISNPTFHRIEKGRWNIE